jgi:hypothetical protein
MEEIMNRRIHPEYGFRSYRYYQAGKNVFSEDMHKGIGT